MTRPVAAESTERAVSPNPASRLSRGAVRIPVQPAVSAIHVDLWILHLDGASEDIKSAEQWLTAGERRRVSRFRDERDAAQFILRRAMRRVLLSQRCGVTPDEITIQQDAGGAPRLMNHGDTQFSTAHRQTVGVVAIANGVAVGVDIEPHLAEAETIDLAATCLHPREAAVFRRLPRAERAVWFTQIWTRKEAILKLRGVGFAIEPRDFCVLSGDLDGARGAANDVGGGQSLSVTEFEPYPGWCGAIAVEGVREISLQSHRLTWASLSDGRIS